MRTPLTIGDARLPQKSGGAQSSTDQLATGLVRRFRPDIALQNGDTVTIAGSLEASGVPVVLRFRDVECGKLGGGPTGLRNVLSVVSSAVTARGHQEAFGVTCAVILPPMDASRYRTSTTPQNVTSIDRSAEASRRASIRCDWQAVWRTGAAWQAMIR